jgi:hypothetical protein
MNTRKKSKKPFFFKWRKERNIADGLSTTFFELKLHSSPEQKIISSPPLQEAYVKERKETQKEHVKMDAPLHLITVIV